MTGDDAMICCDSCVDTKKCRYFFETPNGKCWCECHREVWETKTWKAIKIPGRKKAVKQSWEGQC